LIGIVFSTPRVSDRLDFRDVQTLVWEVIARVDQHLDGTISLGVSLITATLTQDRYEKYLWLLSCEISGWWSDDAPFYNKEVCTRLIGIVNRIDFRTAQEQVQSTLLRISKIAISHGPKMDNVQPEHIVDVTWEYMPNSARLT
jgi:hypothetical protein